jgi:hypothetical protein
LFQSPGFAVKVVFQKVEISAANYGIAAFLHSSIVEVVNTGDFIYAEITRVPGEDLGFE